MHIDDDMLIAYALGTLSPDEALEVERYLGEHPERAAEVRAHLEALGTLVLSLEPEAPPADAEARLLARIREQAPPVLPDEVGSAREPLQPAARPAFPERADVDEAPEPDAAPPPDIVVLPRRRALRWLGLAALAAALLVVWFGIVSPPRDEVQQAQRQLETICADPAALCQDLVDDAGRPVGRLAHRADGSLLVVLEQAPPEDRVYQAWEIVGDTPFSRGVFGERVIDTREPLAEGSVFGLTVEPLGGSEQPTTTPFVVVPL